MIEDISCFLNDQRWGTNNNRRKELQNITKVLIPASTELYHPHIPGIRGYFVLP
jgi:hypothetical protein